VPGLEAAFDALIAVSIVSLLAIRRRYRIDGTIEPVAVSVATRVVLGLVTVLMGKVVISMTLGAIS
jgi:hypothetical protein